MRPRVVEAAEAVHREQLAMVDRQRGVGPGDRRVRLLPGARRRVVSAQLLGIAGIARDLRKQLAGVPARHQHQILVVHSGRRIGRDTLGDRRVGGDRRVPRRPRTTGQAQGQVVRRHAVAVEARSGDRGRGGGEALGIS